MKLIVICICLMDGCHLWNFVNLGDELSSSTFSNGASTDWFRFSSPCHTVLSSPTVKWINSFPVGIAKVSLHSVSCAKGQPFPSSCWPRVHCGLRSSSNSVAQHRGINKRTKSVGQRVSCVPDGKRRWCRCCTTRWQWCISGPVLPLARVALFRLNDG